MTTDNAEQGSRKPRPGRARARRAAGMTVALTFVVLGLTGCTNNTFTRLGFPPVITRQGETVLTLWQGSWIAAFGVCALIWGLVLWAVIFHRKRGDKLPPQATGAVYTANNNTLTVTVAAGATVNQISAAIIADGTFGTSAIVGGAAVYNAADNGTTTPLAGGADGTTSAGFNAGTNTLLVNVGVGATLSGVATADGIFDFTITATRTGTFTGHCSELCGLYHAKMLFTLKVVTPQQFQAYMAAQQAAQNSSGSTQ